VFDFVEIDSSFYRTPNAFMVENWCKKTPTHFRFTAKFPKVITHDKRLKDVEKELDQFFSSIVYLEDKILALLIQLPPSMGIVEGMNGLRDIIPELDKRFRYAVEVRDSSWFQDLAYSFFSNNNMCMVWNQLAGIRTPPIVTTDFLYIRFIGDRTIQEKDFGKIQKDRDLEMKRWARFVKKARIEHREINLAIVAANNHYAGFGPGTANIFRKMLDLSEMTWNENVEIPDTGAKISSNTKQTSLSDFLK
jgi:uncharacterized protein YecE (DUF72 family)